MSQDCNDETNKIIFGDTLLKYLDKVKAKADKEQLKWNGDLQQLKDFITLILNLRGTWKKVGTKNTFREANGKLMINWWHTNKTLSLQGSGDTVEEYEKRLYGLTSKEKTQHEVESPEENTEIQPNKKSRKSATKQQQQPQRPTSSEQTSAVGTSCNEITALWEAINQLKTMSLHHKTGDTPSNQETFTFKEAAMADKIKQLEDEKVKLEYDLEQYKALNLELLRMINNSPSKESELVAVNKKFETELGHVRLLNSEMIKLINSRNQVKEPVEEPNSSDQPHQELPPQTRTVDHNEKDTTPHIRKQQQQQVKQQPESNGPSQKGKGSRKKQNSTQHRETPDENAKNIRKPRNDIPKYRTKKQNIIVAGDSMVKNLKGWLMSRKKNVRVYSFPGATTEDMEFFLKPLIARQPEEIILHIGTNDLSKDTAEQVTNNITKLAYEIERHDIKCTVSSIITRKGELDSKVHQVNEELSSRFKTKFVCNQNITLNHLNNGGLHLNKRGDGALALNFINHIRD